MNRHEDIHFSHFQVGVESSIRDLVDVRDQLTAVVTALATHLTALRFRQGPGDSEVAMRRNCPLPVTVEIVDSNGRSVVGFCSRRGNEAEPTGSVYESPLWDSWKLLVKGDSHAFNGSDHAERLALRVKAVLEMHIPSPPRLTALRKTANTHKLVPENDLDSQLSDLELCRTHLSPLFQAFDTFALADKRPTERQKMRWAWVTQQPIVPSRHPFIYLYAESEGSKSPLYLANPDRSRGILHSILKDKTSRIVWDYANDPDWKIPKAKRDQFCRLARADQYPHLVYVPVSSRLALQISFGVGDDAPELLTFANRFREFASVAVLSAFQEAIQIGIMKLFADNPGLTLSYGKSAELELRSVVQLLLELYPVPPIRLENDRSAFVAEDTQHHFSSHAAKYATASLQQALQLVHAQTQAEQFRKYGATALGVKHTIRRPVHYMQEFVKFLGLYHREENDPVLAESEKMRVFLDKVSIFTDLDFKNLEALSKQFSAGSGTCRPCTPESVIKILTTAKFLNSLPATDSHGKRAVYFREPWQGLNIAVLQKNACTYGAPAETLALIIAELIANAADFVSQTQLSRARAHITVSFSAGALTVENSIGASDPNDILSQLRAAMDKWGHSVHKVIQLAHVVGFSFVSPEIKQSKLILRIQENPT